MNMTAITLGVTGKHRVSLQGFIQEEGLPWTLVEAPGGTINLVEQDREGICSLEHLVPGGKILCPTALEMAEKYHVSPGSIGRLMNLLQIKIHECQLGCFR